MIIVLDFSSGGVYHFRYRKTAAKFIGVSLPTFRKWLKEPFFLHKSLVIVSTSLEKARETEIELTDWKEAIMSVA